MLFINFNGEGELGNEAINCVQCFVSLTIFFQRLLGAVSWTGWGKGLPPGQSVDDVWGRGVSTLTRQR